MHPFLTESGLSRLLGQGANIDKDQVSHFHLFFSIITDFRVDERFKISTGLILTAHR